MGSGAGPAPVGRHRDVTMSLPEAGPGNLGSAVHALGRHESWRTLWRLLLAPPSNSASPARENDRDDSAIHAVTSGRGRRDQGSTRLVPVVIDWPQRLRNRCCSVSQESDH
jgi:hypothetical protein